MKIHVFTVLMLLFSCRSNLPPSKTAYYSITITEIDKPQRFEIPLKQDGWCVSGFSVLENTANDSVRIGAYIHLPPGKTGRLYSHEMIDYKPFVYEYLPYKATKGKIVIQWFVRPD